MSQLRQELQLLSIGDLRQKAVRIYDLKLTRTHTKEDIIGLIVDKAATGTFFEGITGDRPEVGWARIKIHPVPGKSSSPVFLGINGQSYFLPQNEKIDIPIKLLGVLNDAVEMKIKQDPRTLEERRVYEESYPYTLIDRVEGPDPRPGWEVARALRLADHYAFAKERGYWPNKAALEKWRDRDNMRQINHG